MRTEVCGETRTAGSITVFQGIVKARRVACLLVGCMDYVIFVLLIVWNDFWGVGKWLFDWKQTNLYFVRLSCTGAWCIVDLFNWPQSHCGQKKWIWVMLGTCALMYWKCSVHDFLKSMLFFHVYGFNFISLVTFVSVYNYWHFSFSACICLSVFIFISQ